MTHRGTKFGASSSKFRLPMYDTNKHVHVCVAGSKLDQHKVILVEFRVGEACYGLKILRKPWIPAAVMVVVTSVT